MTSTTDTTQHPDVSEISDLTEGLLPPSRTADVRLHLEGCPLCADVRTSLEEIRGLLGTLPGPPRMPADIVGRIDAALAAEALLSATAPESSTRVSRETSIARPELSPEVTPAPRPAGHPRAATGPGRGHRTRRRRVAALGAAFGIAAVGMSVFFLQSVQDSGDSAGSKKADTAVSAPGNARFSGEALRDRVHGLLAAEGGKTPRESGRKRGESLSNESGPPKTMLSTDATVPECVQEGTGRSDAALGVERGVYRGEQAYLVVLPHPTDSTKVQAYVMAATCVDSGGNGAAEVLLTTSYPRS